MAPWHGGSASLTTEFIKKYPAETKKFIAAYARGIELVRTKPDEARQFMKGYTAIEGALTAEVPLAVVHALQRVQGERRRVLPEVLRPVLRQGHLREAGAWSSRCSSRADHGRRQHQRLPRPGRAPSDVATAAPQARSTGSACCRSSGRSCCSSPGTSSSASASSSRSCCRRRRRRSARCSPAWPAGRCCIDFAVTVLRTLRGLPDRGGGRRAAGRAARQQREGVPQRRVPDRLLPLDAVVGADPAVPADLRRLRHQQGRDRGVRRAPDRASSTAPTASSTRASSASWRRA